MIDVGRRDRWISSTGVPVLVPHRSCPVPADHSKFVVIGAGLAGAATAWQLATASARGDDPRAWRPRGCRRKLARLGADLPVRLPLEEAYTSMVVRSWGLWRDLEEASQTQLITPSGALDFGVRPEPVPPGQGARTRRHRSRAARSPARCRTLAPVHVRHSGSLAPRRWCHRCAKKAVETMVAQAVAQGALLLTDWTVKRVDRSPSRVSADLIERQPGGLVAEQVIVCAGGWLPEPPERQLSAPPRIPRGDASPWTSARNRPTTSPTATTVRLPVGPSTGPHGPRSSTRTSRSPDVRAAGRFRRPDHRGQKVAEYNGGSPTRPRPRCTGPVV